MITQKQLTTPFDTEIHTLHAKPIGGLDTIFLSILLIKQEAYRQALTEIHTSVPCEWQKAMLDLPLLGAGGELVNNPKRCAELIEERYGRAQQALIAAKKELAAYTSLVEAAREALTHIEELEEAWRIGAIIERDGLGGTRSNRNAAVRVNLHATLAMLDTQLPAETLEQDVESGL